MKRGRGGKTGEPKEPKPKKEKVHKPTFDELMTEQEKSMLDKSITVTNEEIQDFLKANVGSKDTNIELRRLLLGSPCTRKNISDLVSTVFELIAQHPGSLAWGKAAIETISAEVLEPRTRIKDAFFFPSQESELKLVCYLNQAVKTMLVCVFTITNNNLADAIRDAVKRGVDVRVISDDECMKMLGSDVKLLHDDGIPVRVDLDSHSHMHNKFVVIDDYLLITGSFNWTKQAVNRNQENLTVLDDMPLCRMYTEEFNKLWVQFETSEKIYLSGAPVPQPEHKVEHKVDHKVEQNEEVKIEVKPAEVTETPKEKKPRQKRAPKVAEPGEATGEKKPRQKRAPKAAESGDTAPGETPKKTPAKKETPKKAAGGRKKQKKGSDEESEGSESKVLDLASDSEEKAESDSDFE